MKFNQAAKFLGKVVADPLKVTEKLLLCSLFRCIKIHVFKLLTVKCYFAIKQSRWG